MTEAAHALAAGAGDILAVALDAGYGSHEAFTRAFREQFGVTPESVRARGSCAALELVEAIRLDPVAAPPVGPPRLVERAAFTIAGLRMAMRSIATACGGEGAGPVREHWVKPTPGEAGTQRHS